MADDMLNLLLRAIQRVESPQKYWITTKLVEAVLLSAFYKLENSQQVILRRKNKIAERSAQLWIKY